MYRQLMTVLLCMGAVSTAPQDSSAITYVRPLPEDTEPQPQVSRESRIENLPLIIGGISEDATKSYNQFEYTSDLDSLSFTTPSSGQKQIREYTTPSSESAETTVQDSSNVHEGGTTKASVVKAKFPSPKYVSKLSYFKKTDGYPGSALTNYLEKSEKRKFRSRCRCEKIWNCPKLQITVPRCPEEYFLCCF